MKAINPDSVVLQQVDGHWQKLTAIILWKLLPPGGVVKITADDIAAMHKHFAPEGPAVFTHGMVDGMEFSLVTAARARALAEFDEQQRKRTTKTQQ